MPAAEDGSGNIDTAIVVCFECHAGIHSYNDQHPRRRKFDPDELRKQGAVVVDLVPKAGDATASLVKF